MIPVRALLDRFLRGRTLAAVILNLLPFVALVAFGFLWLVEKGWLLAFLIASILVIAVFRIGTFLIVRSARRRLEANASDHVNTEPLVAANPDWTDAELAVFLRLARKGAVRLELPIAWAELPALCNEVVEEAARELSGGRRGALDFSVPEALLLADRVLTRLREDLRAYVPLADLVSINSLWWAWRNRAYFQAGVKVAKGAWSLKRLSTAPLVGVLQEVQNMVLGGTSAALQITGEAALQRLIVEEVVRAAVDLHSGQLRFSDAELLEIELASRQTDADARAQPDLPLRLVVVGQVSAGKTSLINALAGQNLGETDITATTRGLVSHDILLSETDFTVVDTEGIDGSKEVDDRLLAQLLQADLVLWVARANRPARAEDAALLRRLAQALESDYRRRRPRVIVAVTAVDQLLSGWPFPEHVLPDQAVRTVAAISEAITRELGERTILPVSSAEPNWNIAQLETLIGQEAGHALAVQRSRRRMEGETQQGFAQEVRRAGRGAMQLGQLAMRGLLGGNSPKP